MPHPTAGPAEAIAASLTAALTERTVTAFERLLAEDVRWGGDEDTEQTCHNRSDATAFYAGLLAAGVTFTVAETRVSGDQVRMRLRVSRPAAGDDSEAEYDSDLTVALTVRDGVVANILQLDHHAESPAPVVELLYFDGCPNHEAFLPHLRRLLTDNGLDSPVRLVNIATDDDARRLRFLGSPSVRVDGHDVDPAAGAGSYGLQCRLYGTPTDVTGVPPDEWILAALRTAERVDIAR